VARGATTRAYADDGHGFKKKANSDYFGAASMRFWQQHLLP